MKTKELNKEIAALKAKHKLQNSVEKKLKGIDPDRIYTNDFDYKKHGTKYTFHVRLCSDGFNKPGIPFADLRRTIQQIIKAYPPTRKNTIYTASDDQPTASGFVLRWDNGYNREKVTIEWNSGKFWAHIDLPIEFYSNDCKEYFTRKVYDCEHHYFLGVSYAEIQRKQLPAYRLAMFERIQYYGGSVTNYVKNVEDVEEFEFLLLNGHIEQHADLWQKQLTEMDIKN